MRWETLLGIRKKDPGPGRIGIKTAQGAMLRGYRLLVLTSKELTHASL